MGNAILSTKQREGLYYLPPKWFLSEIDVLVMDDLISSNRGIDQLHQEAEEYDFLLDKTPKALPVYWEEED